MSEYEAWNAFWDDVSRAGRTEVIRDIEVPVPTDVPLDLEERRSALSDSSAFEDYAELVGMLFGKDVPARWKDAGMGLRELQTAFAWGMAQASGEDITFRQAYETVMAADDDEGKPAAPQGANRAARRAAAKKPSAATGGPSKRTSSGSTASARTTSR